MKKYREALVEARPEARLYAESVAALPESIVGLRGRIARLALHPIKSLGILGLSEAVLFNDGLADVGPSLHLFDRMAMVVQKEKGSIDGNSYLYSRFSQREDPALALAKPIYDADGKLCYTGPNMESLEIPRIDLYPQDEKVVGIKVIGDGDVHPGIIENGLISEWVREFLQKNRTSEKYNVDDIAVALPPKRFARKVVDRLTRPAFVKEAQTLFSDGGQLLVTNQATLDWMNEDLARQYGPGFKPIVMQAFRPNIVLEGLPSNTEDLISRIVVHSVISGVKRSFELAFAASCVRCDVTRVDVETGKRSGKEPLKWLSKNRPPRLDARNSTTFGINAVLGEAAGQWGKAIRVGDEVEVIAEKAL